jgi:hypothetical protein
MSIADTPTYEFGYRNNSYFNGSDGLITRLSDGATVTINVKDHERDLAVNVKDHNSFTFPAEVREMAAEINVAAGDQSWPFPGAQLTDTIYEVVREAWWQDAEWMAEEHGFNGVHSAGRSGGWCVIQGTEMLADEFTTAQWTEAKQARLDELTLIYEDNITTADEWDELRDEFDDLGNERDVIKARDSFLELAFALVDHILTLRNDEFATRIREEYNDLVERREANIIRSEN